MNKGIEIGDKKRKKHDRKIRDLKEGQEDICRFVEVEYMAFGKINGKTKPISKNQAKGLQIRNKVYLLDGHYKFINNKNMKVIRTMQEVPEWANTELISRYKAETNIH